MIKKQCDLIMTNFEQQIIEEFEEKFHSPKTLWAKNDKEDKWCGKQDIADFILKALASQRDEFVRMVKDVKKENESNGRFNACQEILDKLKKPATKN